MSNSEWSDRLRSWRDYVIFVFRYQSRRKQVALVINTGLLLTGIVGAVLEVSRSLWAILVALPLPLWEALGWGRELGEFRRNDTIATARSNTLVKGGRKATIAAIQPSARQARLGFTPARFRHDAFLWSEAVNGALRTHDWQCLLDEAHAKRVSRAIRENRDFCLKHLTRKFDDARGRVLFINQRKWCLCSELDPSFDHVSVHAGGYFESFCTNEACTTTMRNSRTREESSGLPLFPVHFADDVPRLDDLELAAVNNHVGVSTLAITADRYIVVWQQGEINIQDPGKVVATGSGSGDIADLDVRSLRNTVIRGMERELREEGLRRELHWGDAPFAETTLLAFFRWLDRGGKPEFVGVTRLNVPVADVLPDHREVFDVKKKRGERLLENKFHLGSPSDLAATIRAIRGYESKGARLSLPLKVILARLEQLSATDPMGLSQILFGMQKD